MGGFWLFGWFLVIWAVLGYLSCCFLYDTILKIRPTSPIVYSQNKVFL
jgi:hypothetical protein